MLNLDIKEQEYVQNTSWLVKENANTNKSAIGLMYYTMIETAINEIYQKLPQDAVKLHKESYIHIHKIRDGAWYIPYCSGHDPTRLLTLGLKTPSIESKPPKHLDSAIDQLINFIMIFAQERSGAISLNLIDLYLAPFVRHEHLTYEEVKQQIQRFIYNLNYTTRLNYQTPFSNIVLGFTLPDLDKIVVYYDGKPCGRASEYLDEILMINKALCEIYLEGDAKNRPFSVAGDEITIVKLNGKIIVDYIGNIIDKLFEKYKENVIIIGKYEILPILYTGIDLEVLGISKNKVPVFQKVLFVVRHKENELLKLTTECGFSVKVTKSHSVLVWNGSFITAKKAEELETNDELVVIKTIPFVSETKYKINIAEIIKCTELCRKVYVKFSNGKTLRLENVDTSILTENDKLRINGSKWEIPAVISLDERFGYLIGLILADGYFSKKGSKRGGYEVSIGLNLKKEKELALKVVKLIEEIFNIRPKIRIRQKVNLVEVRIFNGIISTFVRELIKASKGRKVPEIFLCAPRIARIAVIAGLIDGDGYVRACIDNSNKKRGCIVIYNTDKLLIMSVAYLLASLNIPFTLFESKIRNKSYYHLRISLYSIPKELLELSWKLRNKKDFIINKILNKDSKIKPLIVTCADGSGYVIRMKLKSKEYTNYNGYVYDFTTASESFLANMFIVHNTFPIPTIIYTRELEKYTDILELIWKVTAERGQFYFINSYLTDRSGIFSMCCRLTIDLRKVMNFIHQSRGLWSLPPATGSIGYVSINLPRIGFEMLEYGHDEKYIYDRILELMLVGRRVLNVLRERYYKLFREGLYPMTKIYVDPIDPFKYYFNTISTVGLAELIPIIIGDPFLWKKEIDLNGRAVKNNIVQLMKNILSYMLEILKEFEAEDHVLYNLEQAPAESASTKFAFSDYLRFPKYRQYIPKMSKTEYGVNSSEDIPYYTSMNTPPYTTYRLETQLAIEAETQKLYTGGVIKHIFVHRPIDSENVGKLIQEIMHNYDLVYLTYTPTQSVCPNCGYRTIAIMERCPKCGNENMEIWSRIVGYYRPVHTWNIGKIAEFYSRRSI